MQFSVISPAQRTLMLISSVLLLMAVTTAPLSAQTQRPMSFVDVQELARPGSWTPSPDGQRMLYTISTPDWQEDTSQVDLHLVSMSGGLSSSRQMTFTTDDNESSPQWSRDSSFFVFASDRDAPVTESVNQLYFMRPDGGEARQITNVEKGVVDFAFSFDGTWLAYRSGEVGLEQLYRLPVDDLFLADADQVTDGEAGIEDWTWARDSQSIYFIICIFYMHIFF